MSYEEDIQKLNSMKNIIINNQSKYQNADLSIMIKQELDGELLNQFIRKFVNKIIVSKINNNRYNINLQIYLNIFNQNKIYLKDQKYSKISPKNKYQFTYNVYLWYNNDEIEGNTMEREYIYKSNLIPEKIIVNNEIISRENKIIIAGPCTISSYEEAYSIAKELKKQWKKFLWAGTYKSRTNPYSFQGLQDEGIEILIKIKNELDLSLVTELQTIEQVKKYAKDIDIIQVGSRNMYNYELLKELGKIKKPILLKRGLTATYYEWLLAAEYILKEGNFNVILCEEESEVLILMKLEMF